MKTLLMFADQTLWIAIITVAILVGLLFVLYLVDNREHE
jgi:hypothetical protein